MRARLTILFILATGIALFLACTGSGQKSVAKAVAQSSSIVSADMELDSKQNPILGYAASITFTPAFTTFLPIMMNHWPPVPDAPVLNPINNPNGSVNYAVTWNAAPRADTYTLQEDTNNTFTHPITRYSGSGTSWSVSAQAMGIYYYRVKANNSWGDSGWSNIQSVNATSDINGGVVGTITRPGFLPTALALDEARNRLFVFDKSTHKIFIYNATTLQEIGSVATTLDDCFSMVIDKNLGKLYAGYFGPGVIEGDYIAVIDIASGTLLKYLTSAGYNYLVVDQTLDVVYVSHAPWSYWNGNTWAFKSVERIDVATDVMTPIEGIQGNIYTSMAVNPVTHELFVANWSQNDSNLFIVNPTTLDVAAVPNMAGFGVAVNWNENKVYVTYCASAGMEGVCIYDRDSGITNRIYTTNDSAWPLVFNPNVNRLYSDTEVNAITTIFNGATDEFTNVNMESSLISTDVHYWTDNVYHVGVSGTYVMKGATGKIVTKFLTTGMDCTVCISAVVVGQSSGRVYVINETTGGTVMVIQDGQF